MYIYGIEFKYPLALILIIIIPIFLYLELKRKEEGIIFIPFELIKKIYKRNSFLYIFQIVLKVIFIISFIIMLTNPGINNYKTDTSKKGIDIGIILDISKSMLAEDMLPNRLEVSKKVIKDFILGISDHRLSFTIFAGKPFLSVPLTFEYNMLIKYVSELTTENIKQEIPGLSGTAIGDGLIVATDSLKENNNSREKIIVLITDGDANVGIDPKIAIKYVIDKKIKVYTIGIGDPNGTELFMTDGFGNKQYFMDANGIPIKAKLDEEMLKYLANISGGKYYNSNSKESLNKIFNDISKLHKTEIITKKIKTFFPIYKYFVYLNFIIIIFLIFIKEKQRLGNI